MAAWENKPNPGGYAPDWERHRSKTLQRDRGLCTVKYKGCLRSASEVDHIDQDVLNNDPSNLRSVCTKCHQKITSEHAQEARTVKNPREAKESPGILDKAAEGAAQIVNDMASQNEEDWFRAYGPVFEKDENGKWKKPEYSLAPYIIAWVLKNLQIKGQPFKFTPEQTRILYWMYAVDEDGRWLNRKTLHIAPKGWGKDPFGAALCAIELAGPCRFSHWDEKHRPIPKQQYKAWVQVAAFSQGQNANTWSYLADIFNEEATQRYGIDVQRENVWALRLNGARIQSISAGSRSLEGNFQAS